MLPLHNASIQKGEHNETGQRYVISSDEGRLKADLTPGDNIYRISHYEVNDGLKGQGYGKELLRLAKEHAESLGVKAITSSLITSDESAGAMAAVFHYNHLTGRTDPKKVSSLVELFPEITLYYPIAGSDC